MFRGDSVGQVVVECVSEGRAPVWLAVSLALMALWASVAPSPASAADAIRIGVKSGVLVGTVDSGVESFKGIPYAAPPEGALRWKLPQPAPPWTQDRPADDFGPSCMQHSTPRNVSPTSRAAQLSEDCLTLNVWAPQAARKAPVMVWIHGGGNDSGSSADNYYDGTAFARDGIVLVSINYRLGSFGFQAHNGAANFGLWDQVAASGLGARRHCQLRRRFQPCNCVR
jgi:para-nitrobenzyl esterase